MQLVKRYWPLGFVAALFVGVFLLIPKWDVNQRLMAEAATLGPGVQAAQFGGRCTLATGTPVMSSSVLSGTTMYYTPAVNDRVTLYNGSDLVLYEISELTNLITATTGGAGGPARTAASSVYDYFVWNNSGTIQLVRGPLWTNSSTRASTLSQIHGVYVNVSAITNGPAAQRGSYVCTAVTDENAGLNWRFGTVIATGGQSFLGVWNMYNRKMTSTGTIGTSNDSWSFNTSGAWRIADLPGVATSGISAVIVRGLDEEPVSAKAIASCDNTTTAGRFQTGIGLDSSLAIVSTGSLVPFSTGNNAALTTLVMEQVAFYEGLPGIGAHQYFQLEGSTTAATCNGDAAAPTIVQSGMIANSPM